jgi:dTDP-4-amino-4,6-dideoxygalactose transaminase
VRAPAAALVDREVPFAPPALGREEIAALAAVIESGWLTTGPRVREFEERFASYVGAAHAVAVNSCTAALHLSLLAAGVGPGDEVITTPLTFCATANTIVHTGATPVFADIDPVALTIDPNAIERAIGARTRAIMPVHYGGRPADMDPIAGLASHHGLTVIEDAAHCVEGVYRGRKIGSLSRFTAFSFYATKNLTTGEGGMLTTDCGESAERIRIAALHGMSRDAWGRYTGGGRAHYDVVLPGFKYNLTDLQAAIGLCQLDRLAANLERRERLWKLYDEGLGGLPVRRPAPIEAGSVHARHLYTIQITTDSRLTRDALADALRERGIQTSIHFGALHLHSYYADRFGYRRGMFPCAERVSDSVLSLPFSPALGDDDIEHVAATIRELLE